MKMRKRLIMMLAGVMTLASVMCFGAGNHEVYAADTSIVEDVMNVKCQITAGTTAETTNAVNMRIVASVENLNYNEVGFKIYYNGSTTPVTVRTTTVFERIVASAESGVDYNYNPKVIDVDSKYFVTATLTNIARKNFDNTFYIKPYGIREDGETVYGTSRYVRVSDSYNDIVKLPVKVTAQQAADMVMSYDTAKLTQDASYQHDGTYAHLTFKVNEGQKLPSVTEIVAKDSTGNVITTLQHRNLLTAYSGSGTADTSWYDADATDKRYVIVTAADLYGFAELSASNDFATDTIYLGADIKVNEGNASDWNSTTKPSTGYDWIPIGRTADTAFAGVFDGFGDTISGLYLNSTATYTGLFGRTKAGSTVQNLRLENSYFCDMVNANAFIAGIAGKGEGNFDTVYTSATLEATGSYVGGISAWIESGSKNTFSNCWNDGKITASGVNVGGIIGYSGVPLTLKNCLNSGTITSTCTDTFGYVGGLIGRLPGSAVTTLEDCLNTGNISVKTTKRVATLIGCSRANLTFTDVYTTNTITHADGQTLVFDSGHNPGVGTYSTNEDTGVTPVWTGSPNKVSSVKGFDANTNLAFDFVNDWSSIANGNPQLKPFATQGILKPTDTSWYSSASSNMNYTITTVEELYGFAQLSQTETFDGWTIKLGDDIIVNKGDAESWGTSAPKYGWTPIAKDSFFNGTFDGQGYAIEGIYLKTDKANAGLFGTVGSSCEIKNFSLKNSYMESNFVPTNTSDSAALGSIVGYATKVNLDSVYSDATVICTTARDIGGLVGIVTDSVAHSITNCWFDGEVHGYIRVGGFVGQLSNGTMQMTDCLSTGMVTSDYASGGLQLGGFCGRLNSSAQITFTDCLNVGDVQVDYGVCVGSYVGWSNAAGQKTTFTNSCSIEKFTTTSGVTVGKQVYGVGNNSSGSIEGTLNVLPKEYLQGYWGYQMTGFDFANTWVAKKNGTPELKTFSETESLSITNDLIVADTSWYNSLVADQTIADAADFYGLTKLSMGNNTFSGKVIKLSNDINLNPGWKITDAAPVNPWIPIGKLSGSTFAGSFDGDGHVISGVYVNTNAKNIGLFANSSGMIKNFRLENSQFTSTYSINEVVYVGSVAGFCSGDIDSVYSNAIVTSANGREVGGIVGRYGSTSGTIDAPKTISNCWFDGELNSSGRKIGGIVGSVNMGTKAVRNCLNTGTINNDCTVSTAPQVAGIVGMIENTGDLSGDITTLYLTDTLNAGIVSVPNATAAVAGVVAHVQGENGDKTTAVLNVERTYMDEGTHSKSIAIRSDGTINGDVVTMEQAYLAGKNAVAWTELDFTNYWAARADKDPALKSFVATSQQLDVTGILPLDMSWYDTYAGTEADPYIIADMGDLYGLSYMSMTEHFIGKTFKVTNDITVNSSVLDTVDKNKTPEILWRPIGQIKDFGGTFGGASSSEIATISGLYCKENKQYVGLFGGLLAGSTVHNLSLKDSYFESTYNDVTDLAYVGTIAGYAQTGLSNVYSNATAVGKGQNVGGLIGRVNNQSDTTASLGMTTRYFTNCWFDGNVVSPAQKIGGLLGELTQGGLNMTDCLFTGTVTSTFKDGDNGTNLQSRAGGLCGYVQNSNTKVDITDCISTGKIIDSNSGFGVGTIIGRCSGQNQGITLTDVYATAGGTFGSCESTVNGKTYVEGNTNEVQDDDRLIGYIDYLNGGGLDFANTWTLRTTGVPGLKLFVPSDEVYVYDDDYNTLAFERWWECSLADAVDMGVSNYVITYPNSKMSWYTDYQKILTSSTSGFTKVYDNTSDSDGLAKYGVYNSVFTKEDGGMNWVVTVTHAANTKNTTYVSVNTGKTAAQALSGHMVKNHGITYAASDGYTTSGKTVTLRMNEVWYMGSSFVIQLPNGHFIINDGGADHEFKYLIDDLYKLTNGKKPIIEAWTISHLHYDHSDVFSGFYDDPTFADDVYVEAIYINEPSHATIERDGSADSLYAFIRDQRKGIKLLRTTTGELPKIYRYQTGQRFYFEGVTMDVVQAQEQIPLSTYSDYGAEFIAEWNSEFNTTSAGLMFTIDDGTTAGKKVYIGGDQTSVNMNWIMAAYDASLFDNVNVFVAFHHGVNTWETFTNWSTRNYTNKFDIVLHPRHKDVTEAIFQQYSSSLITACKKGINGCYSYATGTKILTFNKSGISVTSEANKTWEYHVGQERYHDSTN